MMIETINGFFLGGMVFGLCMLQIGLFIGYLYGKKESREAR